MFSNLPNPYESTMSLHEEGNARFKAGEYAVALSHYEAALKQSPKNLIIIASIANAHSLLKNDASARHFLEMAVAYSERTLDVNRVLLGVAMRVKNYDNALTLVLDCLAVNPENESLLNDYGVILRRKQQYREAIEILTGLAKRTPSYKVYVNIGNCYSDLRKYSEAIKSYKSALLLNSKGHEAMSSLGNAYLFLGDYEAAQRHLVSAISTDSSFSEGYVNLGNFYKEIGNFQKAVLFYQKALELSGEQPEAEFNLGLLHLMHDLRETGLILYESRLKTSSFLKNFHVECYPRIYSGQNTTRSDSLLVLKEQGAGDLIQYSRYVRELTQKFSKITVQVPQNLYRLFLCSDLALDGTTFEVTPKYSEYTFCCHIMSLPRLILPIEQVSIQPTKFLVTRSAHSIQTTVKRLQIGLAWRGSPGHQNNRNRSMRLSDLRPLIELSVDYHSLQVDLSPEESALLGDLSIRNHASDLKDYFDTAQLLLEMDIVVSVDTSVAHLAASLGKPVLLLVPFIPDFRWGLHKKHTGHYPTMELMRQSKKGDWSSPLVEVQKRIREMMFKGVS